ncbi:uncharacterized protein LOC143368711 [Andrena cerasifolii]|uniref:uncharacterized protein LOC143368711 n=1 Tax=Andrena cerasifolii TaxID=2819439 RepID=UPI004037A0CB
MSFALRCSLWFYVLVAVLGAPRRSSKSLVPTWYLPCGGEVETEAPEAVNFEEDISVSLGSLSFQHKMTLDNYLTRDYEYLYERVRIGVHQHQYIPNWVPGKKDVNRIKSLANATPQMIVNHFPKLHMDLQKFAVAFEELVEDETNPKVHDALRATQSYLMMMLCEVESSIVAVPTLQIPLRVQRSIMSNIERDPVDDTRRLVRDWGVLLKYRDYLHAWRHVFNN